ncbi:hypothetical protein ACVINZ_000204 [Mesorhizobium jarvisii]
MRGVAEYDYNRKVISHGGVRSLWCEERFELAYRPDNLMILLIIFLLPTPPVYPRVSGASDP